MSAHRRPAIKTLYFGREAAPRRVRAKHLRRTRKKPSTLARPQGRLAAATLTQSHAAAFYICAGGEGAALTDHVGRNGRIGKAELAKRAGKTIAG